MPVSGLVEKSRVLGKMQTLLILLVFPLTSFHHAHFVTLSETTGLAALPPIPVYSALIGRWAHIVIVT